MTDELDNEEQLLGLKGDAGQQQQPEEDDGGKKEKLGEEEAEKGMEMEGEFEGEKREMERGRGEEEREEDGNEEDDDGEEELEREMGEGGELANRGDTPWQTWHDTTHPTSGTTPPPHHPGWHISPGWRTHTPPPCA